MKLGVQLCSGSNETTYVARITHLRRSFEVTPLLPGKSLVSEHLCTDMKKLYNGVDPFVWDREKENATLNALRNFAVNCRKRDEREHEIRLNQNLPDGHPVSIPYPGILKPLTDKHI
jgi:hypothetical protein